MQTRILGRWTPRPGLLVIVALAGIWGGGTHALEAPKWAEPEWRTTGDEAVALRYDFGEAGGTARYYIGNETVFQSGEQRSAVRGQCIAQVRVDAVAADGSAEIDLRVTKGTLRMGDRDIGWAAPSWGRLTLAPNGVAAKSDGLLGERSLPTLPEGAVKVGSKWSAPFKLRFSKDLPLAVASGRAHYELLGMADVDGRTWVKIRVDAGFELPRTAFSSKQLGLRFAQAQPEEGKRLAVEGIEPDSAAAEAGVRAGDAIVSLGGMPVGGMHDLLYAVAMAPDGKALPLIVQRGGAQQTIQIAPRVVRRGHIEATGSMRAVIVFDTTQGMLVRRTFDPWAIHTTLTIGDRTIEQIAGSHGILQLLPGEGDAEF